MCLIILLKPTIHDSTNMNCCLIKQNNLKQNNINTKINFKANNSKRERKRSLYMINCNKICYFKIQLILVVGNTLIYSYKSHLDMVIKTCELPVCKFTTFK